MDQGDTGHDAEEPQSSNSLFTPTNRQTTAGDIVNAPLEENSSPTSATRKRPMDAIDLNDPSITLISSAFEKRIATYCIKPDSDDLCSPKVFLMNLKGKILKVINGFLSVHKCLKIELALYCTFAVYTPGEDIRNDLKSFENNYVVVSQGSDIENIFHSDLVETIVTKSEEFEEVGSGWTLVKCEYVNVHMCKYAPLRGATCIGLPGETELKEASVNVAKSKYSSVPSSSFIDLPETIQLKKACINVKNEDEACFAWAIVSAVYPTTKHSDRLSSYPHYNETNLNFEHIQFPTPLNEIKIFERQNDISIHVFGLNDHTAVELLYISPDIKSRHVNLLYFEEGNKHHYCWIKSLSRLISMQVNKNKNKVYFCETCISTILTEDKYKQHKEQRCSQLVRRVPSADKKMIKFKRYERSLPIPFVIYADFESILRPVEEAEKVSYIQHHEPHSFAYYLHCNYDDTRSKFRIYRGSDCAEKFVEVISNEVKNILEVQLNIIPINMTSDDQNNFENAIACHICSRGFSSEPADKVKDHCHFTGRFRGAAHSNCNINFTKPKFVPVIFHNFTNYDSHLFIKALASENSRLNCIARTKEKYITISKTFYVNESEIELKFIDSCQFLKGSLDHLSQTLNEGQLKITTGIFQGDTHYVKHKWVFPYDHVDDVNKLKLEIPPPKAVFYNKLTDRDISDDDYKHFLLVWKHFNIRNLGEYSDLYLKIDVLLLADIFENFRETCLEAYNLDPCHYVSAPSLSWDAMLKHTGVELELLTDIDMIDFIKSGIRGGISQVSHRHSIANNKYMSVHDPAQESKFILYLDANNLYGWSMSQCLPRDNFRWLSEDEINNFKIDTIPNLISESDCDVGYVLQVDLEYPQELHDAHNALPFCAEHAKPPGSNLKKMMLLLNNKKNYIIHYLNLKQCIANGLVLKKIHKILRFNQSKWLEKYISLNTSRRIMADNSSQRDFYKLMNNSIYGKTIENVEKRLDVRLVTNWSDVKTSEKAKKSCYGAERHIAKPNFHSATVFTENFVALQFQHMNILYDKPILVGFAVLELAKYLMYEFHYTHMISRYQNRIKLLYTDTDSFLYEIKTEDFYKDIKDNIDQYDTSDYDENNIYEIPRRNKKVIGLMKDVCNGKIIKEFVGLKSKMYAYAIDEKFVEEDDEDKGTVKRAKGVRRPAVKKLDIESYRRCLNVDNSETGTVTSIQSKRHEVFTVEKHRKIICGYDDKRYILSDNATLAWGHKSIADSTFVNNA